MAYREIGMWEIHEVLRRVARGEPQRAIQRTTGHSRTTIRRWLRVARRLGWKPGGGEPDEALAVAVAKRARPVPSEPSRGPVQARLAPYREQIQAWLEPEEGGRGLRLTKIQQLLTRQGVEVPPINGFAAVAICLPPLRWFSKLSCRDRPVGRGLTFVPGDVQTRIRLITRRHSLLPTSQARTPIGSPHGSLSLASEGGIQGFHVPFLKYAGLGACCRPGSLWVTRRQR